MKNSDVAGVVNGALVAATLMLVMFWPSNIDAINDGQERAPEIAVPKLVVQGVEFTLTGNGNQVYAANQEPVFDVKAINTTQGCARLPVHIVMASRSVPSPISRMVPMWRGIWQEQWSLSLNPGETRTTVLKTGLKLPANSQINVLLQTSSAAQSSTMPFMNVPSGADSIVALSFSTAVPQNGPAALALR